MILLINGTFFENNQITTAFDNIDSKIYGPVAHFYTIAEQLKVTKAAADMACFDAHLSMSDEQSLSLSNCNTPHSATPNSPASYLNSPFKRASLNSPCVRGIKRKIADDEFSNEFKRLQRELQNHVYQVDDLTAQLQEKNQELEETSKKKLRL